MNFLSELHGSVAAVLICALLFIDEAGVPIPIAPSEVLLLVAGVFVASGAFPIWVIIPAAAVAMTAGMMAGYLWARAAGQTGLRAVAERVGAAAAYERVQQRLRSASPLGIAVCRLLPGLRPYATLVSGAAGVNIRTFLIGAFPALLLWEIGGIVLGMVVGLPAMHFLGRFERLALRGAILIALGAGVWFAIRRIPTDERDAWVHVSSPLRLPLALAIDGGILACIVTGLLAIGRRVAEVDADGWIEVIVLAILFGLVFVVGSHVGTTPGEGLLGTEYWPSTRPTRGGSAAD